MAEPDLEVSACSRKYHWSHVIITAIHSRSCMNFQGVIIVWQKMETSFPWYIIVVTIFWSYKFVSSLTSRTRKGFRQGGWCVHFRHPFSLSTDFLINNFRLGYSDSYNYNLAHVCAIGDSWVGISLIKMKSGLGRSAFFLFCVMDWYGNVFLIRNPASGAKKLPV